jgi:hypothetical protein
MCMCAGIWYREHHQLFRFWYASNATLHGGCFAWFYSLSSGGDQPLQLRASLDLAPVIRARGLFISLKFLGILEF